MMQWVFSSLPTWLWVVIACGAAFSVYAALGWKAATAAGIGLGAWLFTAFNRQKGYDDARKENEEYANDLINEGAKARRDADRRNADPERLRDTDGYRRD